MRGDVMVLAAVQSQGTAEEGTPPRLLPFRVALPHSREPRDWYPPVHCSRAVSDGQ